MWNIRIRNPILFSERQKPQVIYESMRVSLARDISLATLMREDNEEHCHILREKIWHLEFKPWQTVKYAEDIFQKYKSWRILPLRHPPKGSCLRICCRKIRNETVKSRKKQIQQRGIKKKERKKKPDKTQSRTEQNTENFRMEYPRKERWI